MEGNLSFSVKLFIDSLYIFVIFVNHIDLFDHFARHSICVFYAGPRNHSAVAKRDIIAHYTGSSVTEELETEHKDRFLLSMSNHWCLKERLRLRFKISNNENCLCQL